MHSLKVRNTAAGPVTHFLRLLRSLDERDREAERAARRGLKRFGIGVVVDRAARKGEAVGIGERNSAPDLIKRQRRRGAGVPTPTPLQSRFGFDGATTPQRSLRGTLCSQE